MQGGAKIRLRILRPSGDLDAALNDDRFRHRPPDIALRAREGVGGAENGAQVTPRSRVGRRLAAGWLAM
jgi:hypothetical protein